MSKIQKLFEKMSNNPQGWRIEDIETIARHYGFERIEAKGSHTKFVHTQLQEILTVPVKRPIKPIYIKKLLILIQRLEEEKA